MDNQYLFLNPSEAGGPFFNDYRGPFLDDCKQPAGYFHIVFTLPAEARDLVRYNERLLYGTMFREAWAALSELCADRHYLGARPGMVAILHTWGQNLHYHPHVHCIVPGGGLRGGKWVSARKGFFVPVRALSSLFKGKFVSALRRYYRAGHLRLDGLCNHLRSKRAFDKLLNMLMSEDWVVYAKAPFAGPEQLLKYLGRYTHRVAIGNHRIVSMDKDTVCFRWRDYADGNRQKAMRLEHEEFIRRFLQHILPAGFCKIRYYGILSNRLRRHALAVCRQALGVKPPPQLPVLSWRERYRQATGIDWDICPVCGKGRMVTVIWVPDFGVSSVERWPGAAFLPHGQRVVHPIAHGSGGRSSALRLYFYALKRAFGLKNKEETAILGGGCWQMPVEGASAKDDGRLKGRRRAPG